MDQDCRLCALEYITDFSGPWVSHPKQMMCGLSPSNPAPVGYLGKESLCPSSEEAVQGEAGGAHVAHVSACG